MGMHTIEKRGGQEKLLESAIQSEKKHKALKTNK